LTTRRNLIKGAAATALAAPAAHAQTVGHGALSHQDRSLLEALMVRDLARELGSQETARKLVPNLYEALFDWSYPTMPVQDASAIIAFSFGNRIADAATKATTPGPINARLAEAVHAIRVRHDVPVYAQWEIAQVLQENYGMDRVVSIAPEKGADGQVIYLSTEGVAKAALRHAGSPDGLRRAAVVGHRDHVKRCIRVARESGMAQAAAAHGIALPVDYDALSGQSWTRSRDLYLLSDMTAQLGMTRARLIAQKEGG
jgi:hypothetical protein